MTSLLSAVYIEFILGVQPCKLCVYQRIPYLVAIFISFLGYCFPKKNIFDPLEMKDTFFEVPSSKQARMIDLYAHKKGFKEYTS